MKTSNIYKELLSELREAIISELSVFVPNYGDYISFPAQFGGSNKYKDCIRNNGSYVVYDGQQENRIPDRIEDMNTDDLMTILQALTKIKQHNI